MSVCMNLVCLAGSKATGAINDPRPSSPWSLSLMDSADVSQSEDPLVILCHRPSSRPTVIHRAFNGDWQKQPLTMAAINLVQGIGGMEFENGTRPSWLPKECSQSEPASIAELGNLACKPSVDVITFISPTADCSDFIRALRLAAASELLCFQKLEGGIKSLGLVTPLESCVWEIYARYNTCCKISIKSAASAFDKNGDIIGFSPTDNPGKVGLTGQVLKLKKEDVRSKNVPSGESNQPKGREAGYRGLLKRMVGSVTVCMQDCPGYRPVSISIESFMEEDLKGILDDVQVEPDFPVLFDFASIAYLDMASAQPIFILSQGCSFPKAVDELRELLGTDHTDGEILAAIFLDEHIDPKDWHKRFFPGGRFEIIRKPCDSKLANIIARLHTA